VLLGALLAIGGALQVPPADSLRDSVYATPALRTFIAKAATGNRAPPITLAGYQATLESELAMVLRDTLGREISGQIEQLAARADWDRSGRYDLHVIGYRAQSLGVPYSALTFTRMYSVPTLFGDRLQVGMNDGLPRSRRDTAARRARVRRDSTAGLPAFRGVHPLASDRDRFYRFSGGDTAAIVYAAGRAIRLVRVHVEPVRNATLNFAGFRGELDFDADRHQLVRMRGTFVRVTRAKDPLFVRGTGTVAIAYVEFENAEIDGRYWLPAFQRSEFQAQMGLLGENRPIYRIVTRFRDYRIRDTAALVADGDSLPPLPPTRSRLTFAKGDTTSGYSDWREGLGASSARVSGDDFDDLAPDVWRPSGRPRVTFWPRKLEDVARYNRVEGMFTGASGTVKFRDVAPGLSARGAIGWAWTEGTVRGNAAAALSRGRWITGARAERTLASTNDFPFALESGLSIGPLISGVDDYDYVDRWIGAASLTRVFKDVDRALLTTELAWVRDRRVPARVGEPPLGGSPFRTNRTAFAGDYARGTAILEFHPRVTGGSLNPGVGARLSYEIASGELDWQRAELRLASRAYLGNLLLSARVDGGVLLGGAAVIPPQALYELGGGPDLPSYGYKEFGGDRAALGRSLVAWNIPVLRMPRRVWRFFIPGVSPAIGAGVQGGWTEASGPAARTALLALGGDGVTPLSRPTDGVRATADFRLTILSGALGAGYARPLDHAGRWRPFFLWGASF